MILSQRCGKTCDARGGIAIRFYKIAPYWRRPTRIIGAPADNMQMKLRHDVADSGKVDFANGEFTLYEMRGDRRFLYRHIPHLPR